MEPITKLLLAVAAIGVLNTLYLSYHVFTGTLVACILLPDEWCEKVQKSSYSKTFGVPNPYLGFLMLTVIIILTLMYSGGSISFIPAFAVISAGFIFSCYFLYIQAWILKAYCTWCVVSFLVFTALFIIGYKIIFINN